MRNSVGKYLMAAAAALALASCGLTPEEQRAQIEEQVLNHPTGGDTWRAIKRNFPDDFDIYLDSVMALPATDKMDDIAVLANEERWFNEFLTRVQPLAFSAPQAELLRYRDAQRAMVETISETSVPHCARISNGENVSADEMGTVATKASSAHNAAMIRAAAAGLRDPQEYRAASNADWAKLGDAMLESGTEPRLLDIMADEATFIAASLEDRCKAGVSFQRAMAAVSDDLSAKLFVSANMPAPE